MQSSVNADNAKANANDANNNHNNANNANADDANPIISAQFHRGAADAAPPTQALKAAGPILALGSDSYLCSLWLSVVMLSMSLMLFMCIYVVYAI